MQDFPSFLFVCLIIVNKAPKCWLIKTCPSQITASFTNNSIFFLIDVYVVFFFLFFLYFFFLMYLVACVFWEYRLILIGWFKYFWTLHNERWLAFNCLWCLSPFYWASWQWNQLCHSQGIEHQQISRASMAIALSRAAERMRNSSLHPGSVSLLRHTL